VPGAPRPPIGHGDSLRVDPRVSSVLRGELRRDRDLVTVKVWRPDGVLAWTNRAPGRIGKRFELEGDLEEALAGHTAGSIGKLDAEEDAVERSAGLHHARQVSAPIRGHTQIGGG